MNEGFKTFTCNVCGKTGLTKRQTYAFKGGRACREHEDVKASAEEKKQDQLEYLLALGGGMAGSRDRILNNRKETRLEIERDLDILEDRFVFKLTTFLKSVVDACIERHDGTNINYTKYFLDNLDNPQDRILDKLHKLKFWGYSVIGGMRFVAHDLERMAEFEKITGFDKTRLMEISGQIRNELEKLHGAGAFTSKEAFEEHVLNQLCIHSAELVDALRQRQIIMANTTKQTLYDTFTLIHNHPLSTPEFKKKHRELLIALLMA